MRRCFIGEMELLKRHWLTLCIVLACVGVTGAQVCTPEVMDLFPNGDTDYDLTSLAVAPILGQEVLFAVDHDLINAGGFTVSSIAQLDGTRWSALSVQPPVELNYIIGVSEGPFKGLCGTGAGVGAKSEGGVYHFNGVAWTQVGDSFDSYISAIAILDTGNGPKLYVAGAFSSAGGIPLSHIARFDGSRWQPLGLGVDGVPAVLAADNVGKKLYVGGNFDSAGGEPSKNVAMWDGFEWSPMVAPTNRQPSVMEMHDDGSGTTLYMATAELLWRLTATGWDPIGLEKRIDALHSHDTGNGHVLYVSQHYPYQTYFRKVENNDIVNVEGADVDNAIYSMASFEQGGQPMLYLGGKFHTVDGTTARHIARYDGKRVMAISNSLSWNTWVIEEYALNGPKAIYIGGLFGTAGDRAAKRIAKWDGKDWSPLGGGITQGDVYAICGFDDGSGPALFVGGRFGEANGEQMFHIAKWTGSEWLSIGDVEGFAANVDTFQVFDDGTGPALYASGKFTTIGGVAANSIARWDGTRWHPLGEGVDDGAIYEMEVFDDGSGPSLCVAGPFTVAGGQPASRLARWQNGQWSAISLHTERPIDSLRSFDDGSGPALYIGGQFRIIGGLPIEHFAKWDGREFSPAVSHGVAFVNALEVFDDGEGERLYVGIGIGSSLLGAWPSVYALNGDTLEPRVSTNATVRTLKATSMGGNYSLFIGGEFIRADDQSSGRIAEYRGCVTCYVDCDKSTGGGVLDIFDFLCFQNSFVAGDPYACDCDTSTGPATCDIFDFLCFQDAFVSGCP